MCQTLTQLFFSASGHSEAQLNGVVGFALDTALLDALVQIAIARPFSKLFIPHTGLTGESLPSLTRLLEEGALTELSIGGNAQLFAGQDLAAFSAALRNSKLTSLDLARTRLFASPSDGLAVLDALVGHPTLQSLHLNNNCPSEDAKLPVSETLGKLVAANSALQTLSNPELRRTSSGDGNTGSDWRGHRSDGRSYTCAIDQDGVARLRLAHLLTRPPTWLPSASAAPATPSPPPASRSLRSRCRAPTCAALSACASSATPCHFRAATSTARRVSPTGSRCPAASARSAARCRKAFGAFTDGRPPSARLTPFNRMSSIRAGPRRSQTHMPSADL